MTIGEPSGTVPTLGFGLEREFAEATAKAVDLLREAEPARPFARKTFQTIDNPIG